MGAFKAGRGKPSRRVAESRGGARCLALPWHAAAWRRAGAGWNRRPADAAHCLCLERGGCHRVRQQSRATCSGLSGALGKRLDAGPVSAFTLTACQQLSNTPLLGGRARRMERRVAVAQKTLDPKEIGGWRCGSPLADSPDVGRLNRQANSRKTAQSNNEIIGDVSVIARDREPNPLAGSPDVSETDPAVASGRALLRPNRLNPVFRSTAPRTPSTIVPHHLPLPPSSVSRPASPAVSARLCARAASASGRWWAAHGGCSTTLAP